MDEIRREPFQFRVIHLLGIMLWAGIVLASWRSGLLQPRLMPVILPFTAGIGVYAMLLVADRFRKR